MALVVVAFRAQDFRWSAWSILFCFLLLDDSLGLHEIIGSQLVATLSLSDQFGVRGQDFGEMAATTLTGGTLLLVLAVCFWRGSNYVRKAAKHLFTILMIIVFFGVFVESLHFLYEINWKVSLLMVVIEDGGEMAAMSLVVWYALRLVSCRGRVDKSLCGVLLDR